MTEADRFLREIYDAGGTWPAPPVENRPFMRELMQRGLAELIQPESPYLPYVALTVSGERRARRIKSGSDGQ